VFLSPQHQTVCPIGPDPLCPNPRCYSPLWSTRRNLHTNLTYILALCALQHLDTTLFFISSGSIAVNSTLIKPSTLRWSITRANHTRHPITLYFPFRSFCIHLPLSAHTTGCLVQSTSLYISLSPELSRRLLETPQYLASRDFIPPLDNTPPTFLHERPGATVGATGFVPIL